jgi:DNA repair protein RadA/Sms
MSSSWSGRCYNCGEWNTLQEQVMVESSTPAQGKKLELQTIKTSLKNDIARLKSGNSEVDTVFGGGIVAGSVNLLAGEPGIGKSTLLLQLADMLAAKNNVLYVSGEESAHQVSLRAKRLKTSSSNLQLATSASADDIVTTISEGDFSLVVIDSIQSISTSLVRSAPGSISQVVNCTQLLSTAAKRTNTALILVGHVTKEGGIAGPKLLEHMVDVVMQLEGDRYGGFKLLKAVKNRYGSTNEAGIFEMVDEGFKSVDNPSAALLAERQLNDGSIVLATMEGSRPVLVEVQALVNKTSYGYPKRAASGIDLNRVNLLVAMLEKRTRLNLADKDIYINIVGGIKLSEPAADLAICMAIASADRGMKMKSDAVVFGEVGLSGEVRHVPFIDKRIAEAKKLGFKYTIGPSYNAKVSGLKHQTVKDIRSALNTFLGKDT